MESEGAKVIYLPVQKNGIIDLNLLEDTLKQNAVPLSLSVNP